MLISPEWSALLCNFSKEAPRRPLSCDIRIVSTGGHACAYNYVSPWNQCRWLGGWIWSGYRWSIPLGKDIGSIYSILAHPYFYLRQTNTNSVGCRPPCTSHYCLNVNLSPSALTGKMARKAYGLSGKMDWIYKSIWVAGRCRVHRWCNQA